LKAVKQQYPILPPKHSWEKVNDAFDEYTCIKCKLHIKKHPVWGWRWKKRIESQFSFNMDTIVFVSWRDEPPLPCNAATMNEALE